MIKNIHGTIQGYRSGCRCQPCKDASNTYMRDWRLRQKFKAKAWSDFINAWKGEYTKPWED